MRFFSMEMCKRFRCFAANPCAFRFLPNGLLQGKDCFLRTHHLHGVGGGSAVKWPRTLF